MVYFVIMCISCIYFFFCVCVCLQLKTMVFLATMGISGNIYILLLPTENNILFGDYMQLMQMTVFWVFPHEKIIYLITMGVLWKNRHYSAFHCLFGNNVH